MTSDLGYVLCPVCGYPARGGHAVGDATIYICPHCGGYRLAGTAITLLENGTLPKPDVERFRDLVRRKRGDSTQYPTIMPGDLGG